MFRDHPLFSYDNIYRAYRRCRQHKRRTVNAMRFEQDVEANLVTLHEELSSGRYQPGRSVAFLVQKPKQREIFAADFRDRVVHHVLVGALEPSWERRFIHDSYACRQGKGTHSGVDRLRSFCRQATANGTRRAWYLQLDVRGFFNSISRHVLFERLAAKESDPAILWLIRTLVFYDPVADCILRRTSRADFEALPAHKTLFKSAPDCGLPIGNLTSQFFANVYLDALDQFVKHQLKARHYVRYCDDFVLLHEDRSILEGWQTLIEAYLSSELHLSLNNRQRLRPVSDGIDFLGYIVRPDYLLVRRRVVGACHARLVRAEAALAQAGLRTGEGVRPVYPWHWPTVTKVYQWLNAYVAHFARASGHRQMERLWRRFPWLAEYLSWDGEHIAFTFPLPPPAQRLHQQKAQLLNRLPGHLVVAQVGNRYELWGGDPESPLPDSKRRRRYGRLPALKRMLWARGTRVAWVTETGRRITGINERQLALRWPGTADARPLAPFSSAVRTVDRRSSNEQQAHRT